MRRWLTAAAAILPTYPARVLARHEQARVSYGDSWRTRPLAELTHEIPEEGLDVAGWAMLVGERIDELDPDARADATALIHDLVALGAYTTAKADRLVALCSHNWRR